jgi:hypothetical protein
MTRGHAERMIVGYPILGVRMVWEKSVVNESRLTTYGPRFSVVESLDREIIGVHKTYTRRHPRITQTDDLSATLRSARRTCVVGPVLDLSDGGMLVALDGLEVDETAGFELAGPDFRFAGVAKVAHCRDHATGLHFLSWQGPANRPVCTLIAARLRGGPGASDAVRRDPRVLRRVVVFVGTQRTVEREPQHARQTST